MNTYTLEQTAWPEAGHEYYYKYDLSDARFHSNLKFVPNKPGSYIYARYKRENLTKENEGIILEQRSLWEPLYVGQTYDIRQQLKEHLKEMPVCDKVGVYFLWYENADEEDRKVEEARLIDAWSPEFNKQP